MPYRAICREEKCVGSESRTVCVKMLQQAVRKYRHHWSLMLSAMVNVRSKSGCNILSWYKKMKGMFVSHSENKEGQIRSV